MRKKFYFSADLANYYEQEAHDIALSPHTYDMGNNDLCEYERAEWLSEIWQTINYTLHGKWTS